MCMKQGKFQWLKNVLTLCFFRVTKEVDAKSKEGKAELKKLEGDDNQTDKTTEESPQIKTM